MNNLDNIRELISNNNLEQAINELNSIIENNKSCDEAYFLLGNAHSKNNNWREAINAYCKAIEINPDSPACVAYQHIIEIMDFFNHDLYNP